MKVSPMFKIGMKYSAIARKQRGMTLVEVLLAAFVLAVGLAGLAVLFTTAAASAKGTRLDTNSTLVAKLVLEQIAAADPNSSTNPIFVTDCAGTVQSITITGADNPGAGATLNTTPGSLYYGGIDFLNQTYANVPTGYKMQYQDCGTANDGTSVNRITYDVRWNIITVGKDANGNPTSKMITVAARQYNPNGVPSGKSYYLIPANLRAVEGPAQ